MFQAKSNLNVLPCNGIDNRKKKYKKTHIAHKRKYHSRHDQSKHRKRWDLNINNPHLKHAKYTSDYIGPERLTKHLLGFLGKGKISDSISRLEKIMPENCKARSKHDLNRIFNVSSNETHSYKDDYLLHTNESCSSSQDGSNSSSSSSNFQKVVYESSSVDPRKQKLKLSVHMDADNSISKKSSSPHCSQYKETVFCREVITKKLYSAVSNVNNVVFPNISNQNQLVKKLLDLKNQHSSCRKTLSSSNNCESSQDNNMTGSFENLEKGDFKLNPILTQASPIAKSIENMFPASQNLSSSSESDSIMSDDSVSLLTNSIAMSQEDDAKLSVTSSGREGSLTLIPSSPISSSGSPVWAPELSPLKFLPDTLPTPKLFYRQKMF